MALTREEEKLLEQLFAAESPEAHYALATARLLLGLIKFMKHKRGGFPDDIKYLNKIHDKYEEDVRMLLAGLEAVAEEKN